MSNITDQPNYYEILGIPTTATFEEIKQAFRQLANSYHPDRSIGKSQAVRQFAEDKFKQINEAYAVLKDTQKRQDYKRELHTASTEPKKQELIRQIQELYEEQNFEEAVKVAKILYEFLPEDLDCRNIYAGIAYELAIKLGEKEELNRSESYLKLALEVSNNDDFKRQIQADLRLLNSKKYREEYQKKAAAEREKIAEERRIKEERNRPEASHYERRIKEERNRPEASHYERRIKEERKFRKVEKEWTGYKRIKAIDTELYSYFYENLIKGIYNELIVVLGILIGITISLLVFGSVVKNLMEIIDNIPVKILVSNVIIFAMFTGLVIVVVNNIKKIKRLIFLLWRLCLITIVVMVMLLTIKLINYTIQVFIAISPLGKICMGLSLLLSGIIVLKK